MNLLLIGSGGREHALAWKLSASPRLSNLFILPGNPGTAALGRNLPGCPDDLPFLVEQARQNKIDLVVIGPEAPLAAGLADALLQAGFPVFGPSQSAAEIESSKAFSKAFMQRQGIPAAASQTFDRFEAALDYLTQQYSRRSASARDYVIKASGLASGKGVFLPETQEAALGILHSLLVEGTLGRAGEKVVIEERLQGREVSVLAFSDGQNILPMPPVQDHKRLMDGDRGPNTGGMGTFAPSNACPPGLLDQVSETILSPAVRGLREEGRRFVGVLYAGLMLTEQGPRVLEFNCRFGDPETQVLMPLLQSDLLDILEACTQGRLMEASGSVSWNPGAAACVVLASPGYPDNPEHRLVISGVETAGDQDALIFHAGTALQGGKLVTAGGRVLNIIGLGSNLESAISTAYGAVERIHFKGMQYRRDIGRPEHSTQQKPASAYAAVGVSIEAGNQAVSMMKDAVRCTYTPQVLSDVGSFGGLYDASSLKAMQDPVLVASTDGVGTKVDLAARAGCYSGLGHDIVNHCINDILVQGARPLFFLDYYACSSLDPVQVTEIVSGVSQACQAAGCALLGGETAEMPGVYAEGRFDIAGTIIGLVERRAILPRNDICEGDVLIGLASSGPHTNGYSLIRSIFHDIPLEMVYPELGVPLQEALLAPHRSYLPVLLPLLDELNGGGTALLKALAHITGGGFFDNLPRILPNGLGIRLDCHSWQVPPIFQLIRSLGNVDETEMYRVFNMGIGIVAIVSPNNITAVTGRIGEQSWIIGEVISGKGVQLEKDANKATGQ
jgi:phosphoribosylamine--glycine ligase / phosphoribosylformylglycinamidine cyclo-ligase